MRIGVALTRCSDSRTMYTGLVNRPMKVSLSLVVRKILDSFSFNTLHMTSKALCSCVIEAQTSCFAGAFFALPRPRATGMVDDFSAALASTPAMVHWRRKP